MKVVIIGSGVAGCLAASFFKNEDVILIEKDSQINFLKNHKSILRMKNKNAALILGKRVEEIYVEKNYLCDNKLYNEPNIQIKNSYSIKVSNSIEDRSIFKKNDGKRYQFIDNKYKFPGDAGELITDAEISIIDKNVIVVDGNKIDFDVCISTISFYSLLKIIDKEFEHSNVFIDNEIYTCGMNLRMQNKNIYQTIYVASLDMNMYRMTLEKNKLVAEFMNYGSFSQEIAIDEILNVIKYFGVTEFNLGNFNFKKNNHGKIVDIDNNIIKGMINKITDDYGVYCLGRYAVWQPGLMIDDLVQDLEKINKIYHIGEERRKYENKIN